MTWRGRLGVAFLALLVALGAGVAIAQRVDYSGAIPGVPGGTDGMFRANQVHESSGGGSRSGGYGPSDCPQTQALWTDQNIISCADIFFLQSKDASVRTTVTLTGAAPTAGHVIGVDFTINSILYPVRYTIQAGDTNNTAALAWAKCVTAEASTGCGYGTGNASSFPNAMLAYKAAGTPSDGIGYRAYQTPAANQTSVNVTAFDFPFGASNSIAACTGASTPACNTSVTTVTVAQSGLDGNATIACQRTVQGWNMQAGDILCQAIYQVALANYTGQVGAWVATATGPHAVRNSFNSLAPGGIVTASLPNTDGATGFVQLTSAATLTANGGNPTGTASTVGVMMGMGGTCKITPVYSSRLRVELYGTMRNNTANDGAIVTARFGTGTAPNNGDALVGTNVGNTAIMTAAPAANAQFPFSAVGIGTGLIPGTQYWIDAGLAAFTGGTATIANAVCVAQEM